MINSCPININGLTCATVSLACAMLQETVTGHHSCQFAVICQHTRHPSGRPYSTVTHPPWYAAQCHRINQGKIPYAANYTSVHLNEFLDTCSIDFCDHRNSSITLSPVTLSLPDANMQHHLATCCLDNTSLPDGSTSYWWILAANTFCDNKKCVAPQDFWARLVFQVGRHVDLLQLCSFCTHASNHMAMNSRALCHIYQQHLKFQSSASWKLLLVSL
jgi:hypothetical protein